MKDAECELCYEKIAVDDIYLSSGYHYHWWLCEECLEYDDPELSCLVKGLELS